MVISTQFQNAYCPKGSLYPTRAEDDTCEASRGGRSEQASGAAASGPRQLKSGLTWAPLFDSRLVLLGLHDDSQQPEHANCDQHRDRNPLGALPMRSNTPTPRSDDLPGEIRRRRPVSGDLSGKLTETSSEIRKFRIKELRAAADRLVRRAEALRVEAKRLLKIARREEAKFARAPRRNPRSAAARRPKALLTSG